MSADTYYITLTDATNAWSTSDWSWFGYEPSRLASEFNGGQGSNGWRNFKHFLLGVREIVKPFVTFKLRLPPRRRFDWRSEPRWKSERWKAKT